MRTRFAPSPTGSLHVGNARIAVLNWLLTRKHNGAFLLRIEDTDDARNVERADSGIMRDLRWLGLDWDEGPLEDGSVRGEYGPYHQSARLGLYQEAARQLTERGLTFDCYCTAEEVAARRTEAIEHGRRETADPCRNLSPEEVAAHRARGRTPALRFRVDANAVTVQDAVRGAVEFPGGEIGDFILLRADGVPTYNFAVVVDDIGMKITHVIRGVGHLSNTPRQVLLFQAFGAEPPVFAHVPMVLGEDRQKLSKRHGAAALEDYRAEGYHPEALVNYLSLLSWSSPSGEEVLTREELVQHVSIERVGAADVVFDPVKLRWLSAKHYERMSLDDLIAAAQPFIDPSFGLDATTLPIAIEAIRTRIETLGEINRHLSTLFPHAAAPAPTDHVALAVLQAVRTGLDACTWESAPLTEAIREAGGTAGAKGKALYEPVRLALTGEDHGPPLAAILAVQGRERALRALDRAIARGMEAVNA